MTVGARTKFFKNFATLKEVANYAQLYGSPEECLVVQKFGENGDVDSSVIEDVWSVGGTRPKPGAAEQFNIVSTSTNDTSDGTGTRTLLVQGLDADYNLAEEYVTMNGTTNVITSTSFVNIHRMLSATVGSNESNVGTISATGSTSSNVMAEVPIAYNITQMTHYMVPDGYVGYILQNTVSSYKADGAGERQSEISLWVQIPNFAEFRTKVYGVNSGTATIEYPFGLVVRERSLIWFEASAASNNTSTSVGYELLMINKEWVKNP